MKKYLLVLLLLTNALVAYPRCSQELAPALKTVYQFPEGKHLINQVEKEGAIQVVYAPFNSNSHAMWDAHKRTIIINSNSPRSFGEVVRSIFFELHNAKSTKEFAHLDWLARSRTISKAAYVEAVERLEHKNASTVSHLIRIAINQGYFPSSSWWAIPNDFTTHFAIQRQSGHSGRIAQTYDYLSGHGYYGCR